MAGEDSETKKQSAMEEKEWLIDAAVLLIHQLYKECWCKDMGRFTLIYTNF